MRPRFAELLNAAFGTSAFDYLVPVPALLYAAAMLAVLCVAMRRAAAGGAPSRYHAAGAALWAMLGGLVGARALHAAQHAGEFAADPWRALDPAGGLASWGAYMGGLAGLLLYCRARGERPARYADLFASALGLGVCVGRWACFLNGDDYGTLSELPWAVSFPHASYPFVAQVRDGLLSPAAALSLPVHPVQLYLSLNGLALFLLASRFYAKFRARPGATFCFYWVCYCAARFTLEFFRGDQDASLLMGALTPPQALCLAAAPLAAYGLWRSMRRDDAVAAEWAACG